MAQSEAIPVPRGRGIILDFEATCSNRNEFPREEMEIIEIGAVAVNSSYELIGSFERFIRPVRNPILTEFCTELTSIDQSMVDSADDFVTVAEELRLWAEELGISWWGSWGDYDRKQLNRDAQYHYVADPLPMEHTNLKALFSQQQGLKKQLGLGGAVKLAGLNFEGTAHRGIDDTRNIHRIFNWIIGDFKVKDPKGFSRADVEQPRNRVAK